MSPNSTHLERWLGADVIGRLQRDMRGWYGLPIAIADVPGEVSIAADGDFVGRIDGGQYFTGLDRAREAEINLRKARARLLAHRHKQSGMAGFTSLSDLISEATVAGKQQLLGGVLYKNGTVGGLGSSNSLFRVGASPVAGTAAAAVPGGTVPTSASTGAMNFTNPGGGDLQYVTGGDLTTSVSPMSLLLYSRIFAAAVNPNSAVLQSITGVPTLYQNATGGLADSIVGNFVFFEIGTALAATAHNITFSYKDQSNNVAETAPVVTGLSGGIVNRLDHLLTWFCPLNGPDTGIRNLTDVTFSAAVATGAIDAVIGHPHCWFGLPSSNFITPFDFVFQRMAPSRIFDNSCLALLEVQKSVSTASTYTGTIMSAWG